MGVDSALKVLIVGSYNYFSVSLISRLRREKHNTYILCPKTNDTDIRYKIKADVEYFFNPSDIGIYHVIDDIKPDAIVFMGAFDSMYNWDKSIIASNEFLSTLSNILGIAVDCSVNKFIYLSMDKNKKSEKKEIAISTGETLCLNHFGGAVNISILRLSNVFGVPEHTNEDCGELSNILREILSGTSNPYKDKILEPLYVSDSVEAIFRVLKESKLNKPTYSIKGGYSLSVEHLKEMLNNSS